MRADMRNKITIKQKTQTRNSYGESIVAWTDFKANIWASKEPILGNEYFAAETVQSKVEVKFRTRYFAGVTNEMCIEDSEGSYEILSSINVKSLNRELLMYCKKVV